MRLLFVVALIFFLVACSVKTPSKDTVQDILDAEHENLQQMRE